MKSLYESILSKTGVGKLALDVFNRNVRKTFKEVFGKLFLLDETDDDKNSDVIWYQWMGDQSKTNKKKVEKEFVNAAKKFHEKLSNMYKMEPFYQYEDGDGPLCDIRFAEAPKEWDIENPTITIGTIEGDGGIMYMRVSNYDEGIYDMISDK